MNSVRLCLRYLLDEPEARRQSSMFLRSSASEVMLQLHQQSDEVMRLWDLCALCAVHVRHGDQRATCQARKTEA